MLTQKQIEELAKKYDDGDIDALFWTAIEEHAAAKEVTVDYYIEGFL